MTSFISAYIIVLVAVVGFVGRMALRQNALTRSIRALHQKLDADVSAAPAERPRDASSSEESWQVRRAA
ncbi:MAG: hypothetical protein KDA96_01635 [Planctomycetaceae bacterium]|nr:hypothetical protein [Planctomycetaceae bacterium]